MSLILLGVAGLDYRVYSSYYMIPYCIFLIVFGGKNSLFSIPHSIIDFGSKNLFPNPRGSWWKFDD